ncbi:MAG: O-antigen ligase family protein, partial [Acidobacteriota bacterium]|nr:O-antigen ligase family protein [Acidobacteriota bacterium]
GRWIAIGGAAAVWAAGVFVLMGTTLQDRFGQYLEDAGAGMMVGNREVIWASSVSMFGDFPVTGLGFGAFGDLFPRYMPPGAGKFLFEAHNDYLEVLVEGGIVAGILLIWLIWGFWSRVPGAVYSSHSRRISTSRLGLALGVASLSVHAFVDFNHQIHANALLFVTACAMLIPRSPLQPTVPGSRSLRAWTGVILLAVLGCYGYRAVTGTVGGIAFAEAVILADRGERAAALSAYENAAVGENRAKALRRAAHQRVRLWRREAIANGESQADPAWLTDATEELIEALWLTPAYWRNWSGLADVYERKERLWVDHWDPEADHGDSPAARARVGRPGVINVGLLREAILRAPNWFRLHDELALVYWDLGLEDQALAEVRASARAMPVASRGRIDRYAALPPEFLGALADGSFDVLGKTPFLRETDHLIALGRLEWRRQDLGKAAAYLMSALEQGVTGESYEEASYYLGVVLLDLGRPAEAEPHLRAAVDHPWLGIRAQRHLRNLSEQTSGPVPPEPVEETGEPSDEEPN